MVSVLGCIVLITQSLNILALKLEEATKIAVVDRSSSMIISVTIQIIVFQNMPDLLTWIGRLSITV